LVGVAVPRPTFGEADVPMIEGGRRRERLGFWICSLRHPPSIIRPAAFAAGVGR
jgi:hypothetical protein